MGERPISWLAWWYLAIAIGFVLLAVDHIITGDKAWLIGIRLILATGFGLLSRMEFVAAKKKTGR